eukprot:XP_017950647.1 PREDICTED: nibrin isoform X3 [Xenopus tropicalis]
MWRLVAERAGGDTYYILTGTDYVVGRKNCAILIPDDQSISRCHATLSVSYPSASLSQTNAVSVLTIKDSSKYGTTVSGERMQPAVPRSLKPSDEVIFGCFHSKYRVEYEPLVVCSSCLDNTEKNSLKQNLIHLGGHMLNNWTEKCTHLVMTSIKVTIKTICALICCKPIIKPDYFRELINAIQQKRPLPEYRSFIPPIDEPSLNPESLDLSENVKRKSIFKDKVFLFLNTKQYMKLSPAVLLGGGKAHLLESLTDTSVLENSTTCVIDVAMTETQLSETQSTQPWISSTLDLLHSKGLRAIPEAEIGLAVINVSTEIYCNPRRLAASGNEAGNNDFSFPKATVTGTSKRTQVLSSTLSQGMTVDETVLPAPALNMTAYVADTEPQDQTDTGDRDEDEKEVSSAKLARVEPVSSQSTEEQFRPITEALDKEEDNFDSDLDMELAMSCDQILNDSMGSNKVIPEDPTMKKRKVPDDHVVEESDIDSDEGISANAEQNDTESNLNKTKKRKLDSKIEGVKELTIKPHEIGTKAQAKTNTPEMEPSVKKEIEVKTEFEVKKEPESPQKETKCVPDLAGESDALPSRLLLTEFKSLVVTRPVRNNNTTSNSSNENCQNFKKFKKVAYPGAGSFPHIIGGSDLIAHDRKRNAELEQWLRQEVEEQTQQAKEESLAEDLFRYNPKSNKRRR